MAREGSWLGMQGDVLQELQTLGSLSLEEKIGRCTEAFRVG